jgi:hypothetical protein
MEGDHARVTDVAHWLYHSVLDPGNLLASWIVIVVAYVWKVRPHFKRVRELHRHLNPDDPFTLGGDDGTSRSGR